MNKQELIEEIEDLKDLNQFFGNNPGYIKIDTVMGVVSKLDEPQKPVVPQFVADFITEQKKLGHTLSYSIDACMSDRVAEWYWDNSELFARAWLDGYTVEKEKRYLVKVKNMSTRQRVLNRNKNSKDFVFADQEENTLYATKFTRKDLEEAGFGWVFDCPGIEIEEVEE